MRHSIKNQLSKIEFAKFSRFVNAILFALALTGSSFVCAQEPQTKRHLPVTAQTDEQREAERKARFATDRSRPKADGQLLNWADAADRRKIIRRFEEGAIWWHEAGNHREEFDALVEAADGYAYLNELTPALQTFNQALTVARKTADRAGEIQALTAIGKTYERKNEPRRAVEYFNQVLTVLRAKEFQNLIAAELAKAKDTDEMLAIQKAKKFSRAKIIHLRTEAEIRRQEVAALMYIADVHKKLGDHKRVAETRLKALATARAASTDSDKGEIVQILFNEHRIFKIIRLAAQSYLDAKQPKRAIELLEKEITQARAAKNSETEKALTEILADIESGKQQ